MPGKTDLPIASPRFPIEARDYAALAAYAVEQNDEAAIASEEPASDAENLWTTLEQTTEIMERYRAALQRIADTGAPRSSGIARHALGQAD